MPPDASSSVLLSTSAEATTTWDAEKGELRITGSVTIPIRNFARQGSYAIDLPVRVEEPSGRESHLRISFTVKDVTPIPASGGVPRQATGTDGL